MKLADYKPKAARKILVYGPPKSGKTELVGSVAAIKKLWWLDLEDGIKTLLRPDSAANKYLNNVQLFRLPDSQLFPIATETILKIARASGPLNICHSCGRVDCVACKKARPEEFSSIDTSKFTNDDCLVIDSVSQLSVSIMNHIMKEPILKGNDDAKPEWEEYRKQGFLLDRIFSTFVQCHYNIICISHEQEVIMEDKTKRLVPIGGTSNFSKTFAKYFDDVIYTEFLNGKFKAYSDATQKSTAVIGSRTGKRITDGKGLVELFAS